eukprot:scpid53934/ scgid34140/ 
MANQSPSHRNATVLPAPGRKASKQQQQVPTALLQISAADCFMKRGSWAPFSTPKYHCVPSSTLQVVHHHVHYTISPKLILAVVTGLHVTASAQASPNASVHSKAFNRQMDERRGAV